LNKQFKQSIMNAFIATYNGEKESLTKGERYAVSIFVDGYYRLLDNNGNLITERKDKFLV